MIYVLWHPPLTSLFRAVNVERVNFHPISKETPATPYTLRLNGPRPRTRRRRPVTPAAMAVILRQVDLVKNNARWEISGHESEQKFREIRCILNTTHACQLTRIILILKYKYPSVSRIDNVPQWGVYGSNLSAQHLISA